MALLRAQMLWMLVLMARAEAVAVALVGQRLLVVVAEGAAVGCLGVAASEMCLPAHQLQHCGKKAPAAPV